MLQNKADYGDAMFRLRLNFPSTTSEKGFETDEYLMSWIS